MAQVQPIIRIEVDPTKPVSEVCSVISAITPYHSGQEESILQGIQKAIDDRLEQLKGDDKDDKQVRQSGRNKPDQG